MENRVFYTFEKEYFHFNLYNTNKGYKECFPKGVDPNIATSKSTKDVPKSLKGKGRNSSWY